MSDLPTYVALGVLATAVPALAPVIVMRLLRLAAGR